MVNYDLSSKLIYHLEQMVWVEAWSLHVLPYFNCQIILSLCYGFKNSERVWGGF